MISVFGVFIVAQKCSTFHKIVPQLFLGYTESMKPGDGTLQNFLSKCKQWMTAKDFILPFQPHAQP